MAIEPKPTTCPACLSGYRGMDRCATCDGTGSVFVVRGYTSPNTETGFKHAVSHAEIPTNKQSMI